MKVHPECTVAFQRGPRPCEEDELSKGGDGLEVGGGPRAET